MNSSVQCLSNTIPLTDYCLGYDYRKEINRDNVLGTQGRTGDGVHGAHEASVVGTAMQSVEPAAFLSCLCQFAPQFSGGQQHDSQELLTFLLDGIHEDLNRVKSRDRTFKTRTVTEVMMREMPYWRGRIT